MLKASKKIITGGKTMKRKSLLIGLTLALLSILIMPVSALAAQPVAFNASGTISSITTGDVMAAGKSGRWVVQERELCGSLSGDINGDFVLTYKANVDENQAGNLAGKLVVGEGAYIMRLNGKSQPMDFVWFEEFGVYLPRLSINGHWTLTEGAKGEGNYEAWFVFVPYIDEQGNVHVGQIVGSAIVLSGKQQP